MKKPRLSGPSVVGKLTGHTPESEMNELSKVELIERLTAYQSREAYAVKRYKAAEEYIEILIDCQEWTPARQKVIDMHNAWINAVNSEPTISKTETVGYGKDWGVELPDFLYKDTYGQICIGYHGDTCVTDEWNNWLKQRLTHKQP